MTVNRLTLLFAATLCLGFSGPDRPKPTSGAAGLRQGAGDWKPYKVDPASIAKRADTLIPTLSAVSCGVVLSIKIPAGSGQYYMNEYFWNPKKFRIEYLAYDPAHASPPTKEYVAVQGTKMRRLGSFVGAKNTAFRYDQHLFDIASDEKLVDQWSIHFSRLIFSPMVKGNATLTRYVKAISRGVGGYKVSTWSRTLTVGGKAYPQYRILGQRAAKGKTPAGRIEMIFGANPGLPVSIYADLGTNRFEWQAQWHNRKMPPGEPFTINQ